MKPLLIVIWPWKFMSYDVNKIGIKEYEKVFDIEIHDMGKFIYKEYFDTFAIEVNSKKYKTLRFSSFFSWIKRIIYLKKKYKNKKILFINHMPNNGIKYFIISIFLFIPNCICIRPDQPGTVGSNNNTHNLKKEYNFLQKFKGYFQNIYILIKKLLTVFQTFLISIIGRSDLYILTGKSRIKSAKKIYPFSKFIYSNSFDANNSLLNKKYKRLKKIINKKYCVYIDSVVPLIQSDEMFFRNKKQPVSKKIWYRQLNQFFDIIEKYYGISVIISGHPKTKGFNLENYLGKRKILYNKTESLVKYSCFVITRNSAAYSYAIIHQKPLMLICNNQFLGDQRHVESASGLWKELNIEPTMIDKKRSIYNSFKNLKVDNELYKNFKSLYLSNEDDLTNQDLIINAYKQNNL